MPEHRESRLDTAAWVTLLATLAVTPLAVTKFPFSALPLTISPFGFPQNVVLMLGLGVALLLWAASVLQSRARIQTAWPLTALLAMVLWAGVATAAGYEPLRSLLGASTSCWSLLHVIAYVTAAFLITQMMNSTTRMQQLTWVVLAASALVGALALLQQLLGADLFGTSFVESWSVNRGFSTLGNPDYLGTFLVLPLLLGIVLALYSPHPRVRMAAAGCVVLALTAMVGTLTRGAWMGALAGVALAALLLRRWQAPAGIKSRMAAGIVIAAACIIVAILAADEPIAPRVVPSVGSTSESLAQTADSFSSGRLGLWRTAVAVIAARPLTGTGPAAYELGWYEHVERPASLGNTDTLVTDPHSVPLYVLSTTGIPGGLLYLIASVGALLLAWRSLGSMNRSGIASPEGRTLCYIAWLLGFAAMQLSLLFAAVSTPLLLYAFVATAVLVRPGARTITSSVANLFSTLIALGVGLVLLTAYLPTLSAEVAFARALPDMTLAEARAASLEAPWNTDIQRAYFSRRAQQVDDALASGRADAAEQLAAVSADLVDAATRQPREFYYPSVRARLYTRASELLGGDEYAETAVQAADTALAIMPTSLPIRVNKALALSDLGRFDEMVATLQDYWQRDTASSYPGIVYAQALAFSGDADGAWQAFDEVAARFPNDPAVQQARVQTEQSLSQHP